MSFLQLSPSLRGSGLKFTSSSYRHLHCVPSPSLRGSGLKSLCNNRFHTKQAVSLFTREWIEIDSGTLSVRPCAVSLFTREWIEIFEVPATIDAGFKSPSLRGSGLKLLCSQCHEAVHAVSLFTREWIEIEPRRDIVQTVSCLPLYEGVDWNNQMLLKSNQILCLPLYEGVDWNCFLFCSVFYKLSLPLYEGVDWNLQYLCCSDDHSASPSLRGSGLK